MSLVRTSDTSPELELRRLLHARGLRYRVHSRPNLSIRCSPDLTFLGPKVAVFVDGCFWHGCPKHVTWPKANAEWWRRKIERNRERDAAIATALGEAGWQVLRIWEHVDRHDAADLVEAAVRGKRSWTPVRP